MKKVKHEEPSAESLAEMPEIDFARARLVHRGPLDVRVPLATIREVIGVTQQELAERSGIKQSEVSRLERRVDVRISTLERYAKALGAALEMAIVHNGRRYRVALEGPCVFENAAEPRVRAEKGSPKTKRTRSAARLAKR